MLIFGHYNNFTFNINFKGTKPYKQGIMYSKLNDEYFNIYFLAQILNFSFKNHKV